MADVRASVGARPTGMHRRQPIVAGYVSYNRPAPETFDDPIWVVEEEFSSEISTPLSWDATHGGTMPVRGTKVTIGWDDQGLPHVLKWEGTYSPPPLALAVV